MDTGCCWETKHFGWYEPGQSKWRLTAALRRMERVLASRLGLSAGARVLDAGCGVGDVARTLAKEYGFDVTGIDILHFNLVVAQRRSAEARLADLTRFVQADYHRLPYLSASFDAVYTMETFVHAADPETVLGEFCRVLRPGGKLVMFEYSRTPNERLSEQSKRAIEMVCEMAAMPTWLRLNHGELERLLEKAGFVVEEATDVTKRMLPMLRVFYLLGRFPYFVGRVTGRTAKVVNALSGVELYRHQDAWRYRTYVAAKPEAGR